MYETRKLKWQAFSLQSVLVRTIKNSLSQIVTKMRTRIQSFWI